MLYAVKLFISERVRAQDEDTACIGAIRVSPNPIGAHNVKASYYASRHAHHGQRRIWCAEFGSKVW